MQQEAQAKAEHILEKAEKDAMQKQAELETQAERKAKQTALEITEKVLAASLTEDDKKRILTSAVDDLRL
jgi:F0F1-type ATP synthase membrane subunit b/b'